MTVRLYRERRLRFRLPLSGRNNDSAVKHFSIHRPQQVRNRYAGLGRYGQGTPTATSSTPTSHRRKVEVISAQTKLRAPSRDRLARFNVSPEQSIFDLNDAHPETFSPGRRDVIWRSILRDAEANRKLRHNGQLEAFANPEHAAAAYEIMLKRLDWALHKYRNSYNRLMISLRAARFVIASLALPTHNHITLLQEQRSSSFDLTREIKEIAKVTNAIVTRDALYSDHVYRLTAFKLNFHRVLAGWTGLVSLIHDYPGLFAPFIRKRFSRFKLNAWHREIIQAKYQVKLLLDRRLQQPKLPLYHFKKALDFLHEIMRSQGGVRYHMAELLAFYRTKALTEKAYLAKTLWIQTWSQTLEADTQRVGQAFRSVSFFISSHVRSRYNYQSVSQVRTESESEAPIYVKEGLELVRLRHALPRVPLPKIRPNSDGVFPKFSNIYEMADVPRSQIFDLSGYPQHMTTAQSQVTEVQPAPSIKFGDTLPSSVSMAFDQDLEIPDELGDMGSVEDAAFDDGLDTALVEDEDEMPGAQLIAFPSSHGKLQNHVYGEMLQRARTNRKIELGQQNSAKPFPSDTLVRSIVGGVKQSKTHVYAALLREQKVRMSAHFDKKQDIVVAVSPDASSPMAKQWHPSYMRRSDARPSNYGSLLSRFKGLAPLGMPVPAPGPPRIVPATAGSQKKEIVGDIITTTRPMMQDFPQSKLEDFSEPIQAVDELSNEHPDISIYDAFLDRVIDPKPRFLRVRNIGFKRPASTAFRRPRALDSNASIAGLSRNAEDTDFDREHDKTYKYKATQSNDASVADTTTLNQTDESMSFLPREVTYEEIVSVPQESTQITQAQAEEMFKFGSSTASAFGLVANDDQQNHAGTTTDMPEHVQQSPQVVQLLQKTEQELAPTAETSPQSTKQVPELFKARSDSILHSWNGAAKTRTVNVPAESENTSFQSAKPTDHLAHSTHHSTDSSTTFEGETSRSLPQSPATVMTTRAIRRRRRVRILQEALAWSRQAQLVPSSGTDHEFSEDKAYADPTEPSAVSESGAPWSMRRRNVNARAERKELREAKEKLSQLGQSIQPSIASDGCVPLSTAHKRRRNLHEAREKLSQVEQARLAKTNGIASNVEAHPINENSTERFQELQNDSKPVMNRKARQAQNLPGYRDRQAAAMHLRAQTRQIVLPQGGTINFCAVSPFFPISDSEASTPPPSTSTPSTPDTSNNNINQEVLKELLTLRQEMIKMREEMARMYANVAKGEAPPPTLSDVKVAEERLEKKSEAVKKVVGDVKSAEQKLGERNSAVRLVLHSQALIRDTISQT